MAPVARLLRRRRKLNPNRRTRTTPKRPPRSSVGAAAEACSRHSPLIPPRPHPRRPPSTGQRALAKCRKKRKARPEDRVIKGLRVAVAAARHAPALRRCGQRLPLEASALHPRRQSRAGAGPEGRPSRRTRVSSKHGPSMAQAWPHGMYPFPRGPHVEPVARRGRGGRVGQRRRR